MKQRHTSLSIGEQSAGKKLRPFGSASVRHPVREGRRKAEVDAEAVPERTPARVNGEAR